MAKEKKTPKGEKTLEMIEFKLTDEEKAKMGTEAAKLQGEVDKITIEKKMSTDDFGARIKSKNARLRTLLKSIDVGKEQRETQCIAVKNFDAGKMEFWVDGVKLKERELTFTERQMTMKVDVKKGKGLTGLSGVGQKTNNKEIGEVMKSETNPKSKWNQTDGVRA